MLLRTPQVSPTAPGTRLLGVRFLPPGRAAGAPCTRALSARFAQVLARASSVYTGHPAPRQRGPSPPGNPSVPGHGADPLPSVSLTRPSAPAVGTNAETCLLPPEVGPCRARIPSFYYDRYTQSCRQFLYGGCEGNANNFESREACDQACWRIESKSPRARSGRSSADSRAALAPASLPGFAVPDSRPAFTAPHAVLAVLTAMYRNVAPGQTGTISS